MSGFSQSGTLITAGVVETIDGVAPVGGNVAFTSSNSTITITPGVGTVDFKASGTGVVETIDGVAPIAGNIGLTSSDSSITITPGSGTIDIIAAGGGGGITTIDGNSGSVTGSTIEITGGTSGGVFTGSGTTLTMSFTELNLPATTNSTHGVININSMPFMHSDTGWTSTYLGPNAGTFTTTGNNVGIGVNSLASMINTDFGVGNNTAVGAYSLTALAGMDPQFNTVIGFAAGVNYTGSESRNILLGAGGVLGESNVMRLGIGCPNGDPTVAYMGGIYGNAPGGGAEFVFIDSSGLMSSAASPSFSEISLPDTTSSSLGVININSVPFMHAYPGTSSANVFLGGAGNFSNSGQNNIGIGSNCLPMLASSFNNICLGLNVGENLTGSNNVGMGTDAFTGAGSAALNVFLGGASLSNLSSGTDNVSIGSSSGTAYTGAESFNICLGDGVTGVVGESNAMHLGDSGSITTAFMGGVFGVTITGSAMLMNSGGQMGTVVSSEKYKDNIADLGDTSSEVMSLRPVSFTYKADADKIARSGLIAEEVAKIMPGLVVPGKDGSPESVMYHELPVLLLNEMKKMAARIDALESQIKKG